MTVIRTVLSAWLLSLPLAASAQESAEDCRAIDNADDRREVIRRSITG